MAAEKPARVGITLMRGGQLSFGLGYLGYWNEQPCCYKEEEDVGKNPDSVGAIMLDPSLLELQPRENPDVPLYRYKATFQITD